ncbi:hypothetical protein wVul_1182 [Wolbachia endosymbiont of Armadillidium vulgare str. wVulC]|uniref:hypothetical protein n=1 Tax=Wolbachia endosymbiont of Armadillidium vulgare TaxID=77039 RepID=UPI00064B08EE|nr:hypothetical protein [Wolbachia endosymbiont of Armadillidium vulgare]KLT22248.1 hypothetical protein wVul_1182 [Wolbachia endosymbiont of Armadillidium vulgare str. wVulC]OJH32174.1 hypothetical protein Wxf_01599 [Wolbachia endosymbiont of Armadillidium vulgare]OJH33029.1 hypothetical protein Wxf_02495 [Wolbachia endosymbiont of Armadillidium vulgare]
MEKKRIEVEPDIRYKMKVAELKELVKNGRLSNDVLRAHINESEDDDIRNTFFTFLEEIDSQATKFLIKNGVDVNIKYRTPP